ncbi:N-acetylmuramoyl-L-alanine amidase [Paraliobacillus ryukyuensis]|uniref:N-acetylmuramoyl-L-alanine amidase n=1 Tax=Paraliobacillus ryukyuensis TaxID=200904 RepID=UPI0009A885FE|nr:N-acetylmuramoyl-L-alanine amidase [Paraliobacillus ryukyuensis]
MVKIFLDPGHGGNDPGTIGNGLQEKDLTLAIARELQQILESNYKDVNVRLSRTNDRTVSLNQRTSAANQWNADYLLSIHINAGGGEGFESYIWSGNFNGKSKTEKIRSVIHQVIIDEMNWRDRGEKEANFHMLRESTMPAALTENGFIDNEEEAEQMKTKQWIKKVAIAHANGIAEAIDLEETESSDAPKPEEGAFYRVVCGSFRKLKNAKERKYVLNKKGFQSFLSPYYEEEATYYRVIVGSFQNKSNAEDRLKELQNIGFDCFITVFEE